jgi:hypothetical protein
MKISENITCTFFYQQFKIDQSTKILRYEIQGIPMKYPIRSYNKAKSINDVPYWRLYVICRRRVETQQRLCGYCIKRETVFKLPINFSYTDIVQIMKMLGPAANCVQTVEPDCTYTYECWPRATRYNRE